MSDIMVRFLNESYTFPEELKQYVIYYKLYMSF